MADNKITFQDIKLLICEFVNKRQWTTHHNPKNLSMCIAIEAAELMEIFQWTSIEESWKIMNTMNAESIKDELADIIIYCCSMANQLEIDISEAVKGKLEKNEIRFPEGKIDLPYKKQ